MGILHLAGSTALILFAIRFLRKGLDRLLSTRLGALSGRLAPDPARALVAGTLMAAIAPSSSSMATVVSRLSLEQRVDPAAAMTLMLGTNVGLTSLVLLGAAGIEGWYPILLLAGVALFQFTRKDTSRSLGQILIALGFIFLGMGITKQAIPSLRGEDLDLLLGLASNHVLVLAGAAALLTIGLQSSSVTIILLMCLAGTHPFTLNAVVAAVAGANLGLVCTALAIAWRNPRSRLPSIGFAAVKGGVSLACILLAAAIPPGPAPLLGDARTAAGAHLVIALIAAATGLILARRLVAALPRTGLLEAKPDPESSPRYLGIEVGDDPRLAMANSQREILHVSERARAMLEQVWRAWSSGDRSLAKGIGKLDDQIDGLDRDIKQFLARAQHDGGDWLLREQRCQMRYVTQLESIGDVIEKHIADLVVKGLRHAPDIRPRERARLEEAFQAAQRTLLTAETAFTSRDLALAERLVAAKQTMGELNERERDASLARLRGGVPHDAEAIYLDLLDGLKRIISGACAVAHDIIGKEPRHAPLAS